jgi:hypothetical protein
MHRRNFLRAGAASFKRMFEAHVVIFHHWAWNKIHLEMHKPEQRIFSSTACITGTWTRTSMWCSPWLTMFLERAFGPTKLI